MRLERGAQRPAGGGDARSPSWRICSRSGWRLGREHSEFGQENARRGPQHRACRDRCSGVPGRLFGTPVRRLSRLRRGRIRVRRLALRRNPGKAGGGARSAGGGGCAAVRTRACRRAGGAWRGRCPAENRPGAAGQSAAGRRKPELDALRAQEASAAAARKLAASQLEQQKRLAASGFVSRSRLDEAKAAFDRDTAQVAEAEAQIRNARSGVGREGEVEAAKAEAEAARAALAQTRWRLEQKSAAAPAAALVQDTFFSQGEWVPAGSPIVSLLPPGNIKLRFFVPEAVRRNAARSARRRARRASGCGAPIRGPHQLHRASAPSTRRRCIYSTRDRARSWCSWSRPRPRPADAARLHPGQPVDVTLRRRAR
ncbi:MAG: secretion protein HlyD [Comamonadaceae bacterium]|nr:secretion protein HlyD [Comamonadaceae bacterium]